MFLDLFQRKSNIFGGLKGPSVWIDDDDQRINFFLLYIADLREDFPFTDESKSYLSVSIGPSILIFMAFFANSLWIPLSITNII